MQRKHYLILSAAAALLFGCMIVFGADMAAEKAGMLPDAARDFFARSMGGAIVGMAIALWMARNDPPSASLRGILVLWAVFHLAGVLFSIPAIRSGVLPWPMVLVPITLRSLFAFGAFYYLVKMKG